MLLMLTLYTLIQVALCGSIISRPSRATKRPTSNEFLSPQEAFIIQMECEMSDKLCILAEKSVKSAAKRIASEILFKRPIRVAVELAPTPPEILSRGINYLARTSDGLWMSIIH